MRSLALARALEALALPAATAPRRGPTEQRMLDVDRARGRVTDRRLADLPSRVRAGDVVVLNDAATLPASLPARAAGRRLELRLAGPLGGDRWRAVLFGEGGWRVDTDRRPAPPVLATGARIGIGPGLDAVVEGVDARSPRLLALRFEPGGAAFWRALYALGRPVQYAYHEAPLPLSAVQTPYAGRPFAMELPSAGRALTPGLIGRLRARGAEVVALTHAAGLSATGDPALDARLPLPERYVIGEATARAVSAARREGRRVIAVGTSTTRALEGAFRTHGAILSGEGETDLRIGAATRLAVVDAILTGAHDPTSSHHALLEAFAPRPLLATALRASVAAGYRGHELGDSWWIA